jgi:SPP1 gp7 family putative phage head morphogenesis protein
MGLPAHKNQRTIISARKEVIEQNRVRIGFERKLRLQLITAFAEFGAEAQQEYELRQQIGITGQSLEGKIRAVLDPHYRAVIDEFGLRLLRYRKEDSQFERLIRAYIAQFGSFAITAISNTTRKRITQIILAGEAEGAGVAVIGRQIYEAMRGGFTKVRAATIARTETHNAASYANHEVAKQLDIPKMQKQWVAVNDDRTRGHHASMNGKRVPMDEDFIVPLNGIEYRMSRPADPRGGAANNINCRCTLIYVSPEDDVIDT